VIGLRTLADSRVSEVPADAEEVIRLYAQIVH